MGTLTATQAAEAKPTKSTLATSQAYDSDSEEISERPTKRTRFGHKEEAHALTMGTDASRQAVLNTNELLEGILAFLPPKQLFVDQRVCKQWRSSIARSPELQRKMFLRVNEVPPQVWGFKADYMNPDSSK